jgi:hypothetical protein
LKNNYYTKKQNLFNIIILFIIKKEFFLKFKKTLYEKKNGIKNEILEIIILFNWNLSIFFK